MAEELPPKDLTPEEREEDPALAAAWDAATARCAKQRNPEYTYEANLAAKKVEVAPMAEEPPTRKEAKGSNKRRREETITT